MKFQIQIDAIDRIAGALEGIDKSLKRIAFAAPRALANIDDTLLDLVQILTPPDASVIRFYVLEEDGKQRGVTSMDLKVNKVLPVSIKIADKYGNAAAVDGAPAWSVTDASLGSVVAAEDGLSAVFTPAGPVGALKLQVSADADLGEGVKSIAGELDINLLAGDAETVVVIGGEATDPV